MEKEENKRVVYKIPMAEFKKKLGIKGEVRFINKSNFDYETGEYKLIEVETTEKVK